LEPKYVRADKEKNALFFSASDFGAYGDPLVNPQNEETGAMVNPIGLGAFYDEAKRFRKHDMAYHRYHGLNTRIVRILTPTARMRMNDGRVVPILSIKR